MKKLKYFFTALIVALVVTACSADKDSPEGAVRQFVEMFATGDASNWTNVVYIPDEANTPEEALGKAVVQEKLSLLAEEGKNYYDSQGGLKDITFDNVEYNKSKTEATVLFQVHYKNGTSEDPEEIETMKGKEGWRVKF
ncbi:hypothetical protein GCM10007161_03150 [Ignatzschineria indica]|uniref:DUF4878 domain-containing protein n=1 Tax=Ignatzschineria indica TaxID=472583 RepID=A0A2U2AM76_9GAMM|nr:MULTISPECIES: DUF4878 domain-containing protein [Ignatzschineria]MDM1544585.1 DUF4878 domain-containing protein [Ignatzschineria indica]OYQ78793.1 hypothetical protein B9T19_08095 [Ignatzschineria sp. F8392]PWD84322.1 DUF4878 domain-containing protein [Ignatzschineria indica]GGZ75533.1 hypothetical protein GCM10007161_03150 [Ignatzschineria indica]